MSVPRAGVLNRCDYERRYHHVELADGKQRYDFGCVGAPGCRWAGAQIPDPPPEDGRILLRLRLQQLCDEFGLPQR